ncbi:MAG: PEP-utilizing enzyme [Patescibacteria group bacterium]
MIISELTKEIKRETWWSEESPGTPMFSLWIQQFVRQSKYWHPKLPNIILVFFKNDFLYEETPEKQKLQIWNYVLEQYIKYPQIQLRHYKKWKAVSENLVKEREWFLKHKHHLNSQELAASFAKVSQLINEHWRITWVQESADIFTTYELPQLIQKENPNLSLEQATGIAIILCAPEFLSFMEEQHTELLKIAILYYRKIKNAKRITGVDKRLRETINGFSQKYIWLLSNYKEARPFGIGQVWQQLRYECQNKTLSKLKKDLKSVRSKVVRLKRQKNKLYRDLSISPRLRKAFNLLTFWATWMDERKQTALVGNWYLEFYAREVAKCLGINIWNIKYFTAAELHQALSKGKLPNKLELKKRRRFCVFAITKQGSKIVEKIYTGGNATKLWSLIFTKPTSSLIKGQVASAPISKMSGKVQIVLDPHRDKFTNGRILVTTMTRPDFVPLIRRASAIITDEGGITCHAAIISRELGIPCIIGTKVASKILKNGNKVELDLASGGVKIYKK